MANEPNNPIVTLLRQYIGGIKPDQVTPEAMEQLSNVLASEIGRATSNSILKERLEILYDYEKKYLELTKNYKEEIKFAATLQEEIRKERAKFFSETLKDVHKTLTEAALAKNVSDQWIAELVISYTKSLDISAELAKDHVMDVMAKLRTESKMAVDKPATDLHRGIGD